MIAHVGPSLDYCRQRPTLPHSFPCSTIGGSRLNFRVRNGNGCDPAPMTTGKRVCLGSSDFARFAPKVRKRRSSQTMSKIATGAARLADAREASGGGQLNILQTVVF